MTAMWLQKEFDPMLWIDFVSVAVWPNSMHKL